MRAKWILAGVLCLSATAIASPNAQFYTVLNQGDALAGDTYLAPMQTVVGDGGVVATIGLAASGNDVITYSTPIAGNQWSTQTVIEDNTPEDVNGLGANEEFAGDSNLALTSNPSGGTRLTFYTQSASGDDAGILQWDDNSGNTSLNDVAYIGDGKGYTETDAQFANFAVNASGQVLFAAINGSNTVLVRGDSSGLTNVFVPTSSVSLVNTAGHIELAGDNSGTAQLDSSGTDGIYNIPANGGTPTEVSSSLIPIHDTINNDYNGEPILGYTSGNGLSATLMLVTNSNSTSDDIVLSKNGGAPQSILASQFPQNYPNVADGQMSPAGKIAVYVPDNNGAGDTIQYANAAASDSMASVIASVAPGSGPVPGSAIALNPSGSNLYIMALNGPSFLWEPEVNDNGTVAFLAEVGASPTDPNPYTALLDWQPGALSPTELLAVGDQVNIGGQMETISGIDFNSQFLAEQNDTYNDTLSDDGYLAVNVSYDDGNSGAVLMTQISVPEPATIALLPIIGIGLLARRKHRHLCL